MPTPTPTLVHTHDAHAPSSIERRSCARRPHDVTLREKKLLPHALAGLGRGDVVEPGRALAVAQRAEPMPLRDLCSARYSALIAGRCVICGGLDPANGPTPPPTCKGEIGEGNQQQQQLQQDKQLLLTVYAIYVICEQSFVSSASTRRRRALHLGGLAFRRRTSRSFRRSRIRCKAGAVQVLAPCKLAY